MTPDLQKLKAEREADRERHCDSLSLKVYQHLLMQQGHLRQMPTREMIRRALLAATAPPPDSVSVRVHVAASESRFDGRIGASVQAEDNETDFEKAHMYAFTINDTHRAIAWIDCPPVVKVPVTEATPCE